MKFKLLYKKKCNHSSKKLFLINKTGFTYLLQLSKCCIQFFTSSQSGIWRLVIKNGDKMIDKIKNVLICESNFCILAVNRYLIRNICLVSPNKKSSQKILPKSPTKMFYQKSYQKVLTER